MTASSRLVWPVASPWALRARGRPTAYLSSRQRALLWYVTATLKRGDRTLAELATGVGVTSRGQISRELRRLRQLELIGYQTRRGRHGRHRLWLPMPVRRLRAGLAGTRLPRGNDSTSTPFGGFISRQGLEQALRRGSAPPVTGGNGARDGPRRGQDPPRVLYSRCPAGHKLRTGRRSWRAAPGSFHGTWEGYCQRCGGRRVIERLDLELAIPARALSAAELADPELRERRRREAVRMVRDPATPLRLREQLRRDYLD